MAFKDALDARAGCVAVHSFDYAQDRPCQYSVFDVAVIIFQHAEDVGLAHGLTWDHARLANSYFRHIIIQYDNAQLRNMSQSFIIGQKCFATNRKSRCNLQRIRGALGKHLASVTDTLGDVRQSI